MARRTAATRKAEIVATTLRLADELGPDRLTRQAVADAVGLTQPGVFRHFPNKQVHWQPVAETIDATMTGAWETALAGSPAPLDRLALLIRTQLRQIERNPAIPAILHSRELQTENTDLRDRFRSLMMMRFQGLLRAELLAACDAGQIRDDIDGDDGAVLRANHATPWRSRSNTPSSFYQVLGIYGKRRTWCGVGRCSDWPFWSRLHIAGIKVFEHQKLPFPSRC